MATLKNTSITDSGFLKIPTGSGGQRPGGPTQGDQRFNTDFNVFETYNGTDWVSETEKTVNIVTDGLIMYLDPANPTSYPGTGTTWYDLSGNGQNATLVNNPTHEDGLFKFNGTNQYANTNYTFSNLYQGGTHMFFGFNTSASFSNWYNGTHESRRFYWGINGDIYHGVQDGFSNDASTSPVGDREPFALAITFDGQSDSDFYINGQFIQRLSGRSNSSSVSPSRPFLIGALTGGGTIQQYTDIHAGAFMLYNRQLTSLEILQNTLAFKNRYGYFVDINTLGKVQSNPAYSAEFIQAVNPNAESGFYYLDMRDGRGSQKFYVDFDLPNGPWVLVAQQMSSQSGGPATFGIQNTGNPSNSEWRQKTGNNHFNTNIRNTLSTGYLVANSNKSFVYFDLTPAARNLWYAELADTAGETSQNTNAHTYIGTTSGAVYYRGGLDSTWTNEDTMVELHHGSWNPANGINYIMEIGITTRNAGSGGSTALRGFSNQGTRIDFGNGITDTGFDYHFIRF